MIGEGGARNERAMTMLRRVFCVLVLGLAACAAAPTPQQRITSAELSKLAALKVKYSGVITGYDIHGPSIDVSVDLQQLINTTDEDSQAAMIDDVVAHWRSAWVAQHPHQHAHLTVRIVDFQATVITKKTSIV